VLIYYTKRHRKLLTIARLTNRTHQKMYKIGFRNVEVINGWNYYINWLLYICSSTVRRHTSICAKLRTNWVTGSRRAYFARPLNNRKCPRRPTIDTYVKAQKTTQNSVQKRGEKASSNDTRRDYAGRMRGRCKIIIPKWESQKSDRGRRERVLHILCRVDHHEGTAILEDILNCEYCKRDSLVIQPGSV